MLALDRVTLVFYSLATLMVVGFVVALWIRNARAAAKARVARSVAPTLSPEEELESLILNGGNASLRISGELRVSGNTVLPSGFVLEGSLTVLEGARLDALVEVHGDTTLEQGAQLARALLVHGDLTLARGARVPACHVGGKLHLHPEAKVDTLLECGTLFVHEARGRDAAQAA